MSNEDQKEPLPKGQTETGVTSDVNKPEGARQNISIQEILANYPIDRDKCRDVLFVEISKSLVQIAVSLEGISQGLIVANTHLSAMNTLKKQKE